MPFQVFGDKESNAALNLVIKQEKISRWLPLCVMGWVGVKCLSNILFINSLLMIGTLINHGSYCLQTQVIHFSTQLGGEIQYGCHRRRKMYIDIHTIICMFSDTGDPLQHSNCW